MPVIPLGVERKFIAFIFQPCGRDLWWALSKACRIMEVKTAFKNVDKTNSTMSNL